MMRQLLKYSSYYYYQPMIKSMCVLLLVATISLSGVMAIYWWPANQSYRNIEQKRVDLMRDVKHAIEAELITENYRASKATITELEERLESDTRQATLVNNLATLAKRNNIKITSESFEEGKKKSAYYPLYQDIQLEGSYASLRSFLLGVGQLQTWTIALETNMQRLHKQPGIIKARLKLVTYRKSKESKGRTK